MVQFIHDKDKFWKGSPASAEIFKYQHENDDVNSMPWGFDHGFVSDNRLSTGASFTCVASSGWGLDELTISASMNEDGSWQIRHVIKRAT